ncbi:hypothetical protein D3C78_1780120 [compost metagenome]
MGETTIRAAGQVGDKTVNIAKQIGDQAAQLADKTKQAASSIVSSVRPRKGSEEADAEALDIAIISTAAANDEAAAGHNAETGDKEAEAAKVQ